MKGPIGLPPKQGLYDPRHERDACGIGFVVNIHGVKSHQLVCQALSALNCLSHRGAMGCEANTGDGAGILLQVPHKFLRKACEEIGIELNDPGSFGVGMVFLPPDRNERRRCEEVFEGIVEAEGQTLLGWRDVPKGDADLGATAKSCEPFIRQIFIGRSPDLQDEMAFERKLYVIRKRAENAIRYEDDLPGGGFFLRPQPFIPDDHL